MDAGLEEAVGHADAVAAAVEARAAAVGHGVVALDDEREVAFEELVGHVGEAGPQRVAVGPVAHRPAGDAAEADLEQLEPLAAGIDARIKQVRRRAEAGRVQELGRPLAEQAAQDVEDAPQRVRPPAQRGREARLEQRALRDAHVDQVVEAVVEQDLRDRKP